MGTRRSPAEQAARLTDPDQLAALADCPDVLVRHAVAVNPATPTRTLDVLLMDSDEDVQVAAAFHPSTSDAALVAIVARQSLPEVVLTALAERNADDAGTTYRTVTTTRHNGYALLSEDLLIPMCAGGRLSGVVLTAFAASPHKALQMVAASQPDTPVEALASLVWHEDVWVRTVLAANPALDEAGMLRLLRQGRSEPLQSMAQRDDLTSEIVEALAMSRSSMAREHLLKHEGMLERLMSSAQPKVRAVAARHLDFDDDERWDRLFDDPSVVVREAAAKFVELSRLEARAGHSCKKVRQVAAERCRSPQVLRALALDEEALVRRRVARNPILDVDTLQLLSTDVDERTRLYAGDAFVAALQP